ncbi:putative (-)-beta-caryophyllene synthase [Helianthus annuus]|nr:putative (-)-beta-caryophyllene synthase [Helianthus annuus]
MKELVRSYMTETNWAHKGIVPTTDEHIAVSYISNGYGMLIATCFVGMGDMVTDESFEWALSKPPIVKASCVMARLMNDFYSQKVYMFSIFTTWQYVIVVFMNSCCY